MKQEDAGVPGPGNYSARSGAETARSARYAADLGINHAWAARPPRKGRVASSHRGPRSATPGSGQVQLPIEVCAKGCASQPQAAPLAGLSHQGACDVVPPKGNGLRNLRNFSARGVHKPKDPERDEQVFFWIGPDTSGPLLGRRNYVSKAELPMSSFASGSNRPGIAPEHDPDLPGPGAYAERPGFTDELLKRGSFSGKEKPFGSTSHRGEGALKLCGGTTPEVGPGRYSPFASELWSSRGASACEQSPSPFLSGSRRWVDSSTTPGPSDYDDGFARPWPYSCNSSSPVPVMKRPSSRGSTVSTAVDLLARDSNHARDPPPIRSGNTTPGPSDYGFADVKSTQTVRNQPPDEAFLVAAKLFPPRQNALPGPGAYSPQIPVPTQLAATIGTSPRFEQRRSWENDNIFDEDQCDFLVENGERRTHF
ncbi:unnamed protein product [Polarella glacialis]|uniref:Uncharacterized protein n=1 Tax=Polarella glacialis TaxID=89957 RepID=A0A813FKR2_POLGL|nr:unnamed protein product [Polarella glacialis]